MLANPPVRDYLMPSGETPPQRETGAPEEVKVKAKTANAPPTNSELAKLLEAVLGELAELRRAQDELAKTLVGRATRGEK